MLSVQVQVQHITVQQVMLFALIQLPHVIVQAVAQCLIVRHALLVRSVRAIVVVLAKPRIGGKICMRVRVRTSAVTLVHARPVMVMGICCTHSMMPKAFGEVCVQEEMGISAVGASARPDSRATTFALHTGAVSRVIGMAGQTTLTARKNVATPVQSLIYLDASSLPATGGAPNARILLHTHRTALQVHRGCTERVFANIKVGKHVRKIVSSPFFQIFLAQPSTPERDVLCIVYSV